MYNILYKVYNYKKYKFSLTIQVFRAKRERKERKINMPDGLEKNEEIENLKEDVKPIKK